MGVKKELRNQKKARVTEKRSPVVKIADLSDFLGHSWDYGHTNNGVRDMYVIRVQHMDGQWYQPGKLLKFEGPGAGFSEPLFASYHDAQAVIDAHYSTVYPESICIVEFDRAATGAHWFKEGESNAR